MALPMSIRRSEHQGGGGVSATATGAALPATTAIPHELERRLAERWARPAVPIPGGATAPGAVSWPRLAVVVAAPGTVAVPVDVDPLSPVAPAWARTPDPDRTTRVLRVGRRADVRRYPYGAAPGGYRGCMGSSGGARQRPTSAEIGANARAIRLRRGKSLQAVAGLTGISKGYLSMLERGERDFVRRGLLEDLAHALACSVSDLTGQPYLPGDHASAEALSTLPGISVALYDVTLDDVPDIAARPLPELVALAGNANEHAAHSRYVDAGRDLGALLTELHIHAVTGRGKARRAALAALAEASVVACAVARSLGNADLAITAATRGQEAAARLGSPALMGFTAMNAAGALSRLGARRRAELVAGTALRQVSALADPTAADTAAAEAAGMLHLASAQLAAKSGRPRDTAAHLAEAADLAERTGERNTLQYSFGPANVRAWTLSTAVEAGEGLAVAERIVKVPGYADALVAADRRAALHFDLARAFAQEGGGRDLEALRHLDTADKVAPLRVRNDPVALALVGVLTRRARRRVWELDSLKNRFGVR
ncbi:MULTISPECIES: helix-turn-helix domain-containing protein [Actinosynnema]|uniref:helix-turn-helix domain-containing protein n=1 Tax=Actinosynnema TaxID=40566 RepID=UPI0020A4AE8B|nr:helix-turn-helix domain-containing protein [Actinosynnema pretiosum]